MDPFDEFQTHLWNVVGIDKVSESAGLGRSTLGDGTYQAPGRLALGSHVNVPFARLPRQVSSPERQSIHSAIVRLRAHVSTPEAQDDIIGSGEDALVKGMLDIYQRYAHVLPPQFGVHAEDEPCLEEDAEDAGQRATVSALTAEIEQLEFERDAVLDMLGRYERERPLDDDLFEELDEAQLVRCVCECGGHRRRALYMCVYRQGLVQRSQ